MPHSCCILARKGLLAIILGIALLSSLAACSMSTSGPSGGSGDTSTSQGGSAATPTASVDPNKVSQLLALSHEKGPQDVTYARAETVHGPQGTAQCDGKAIFTRSPQRFLLDVQCPSATTLSRAQVYDYDAKKIRTTSNGTTTSATTNIESYYLLHNGVYRGNEQVDGVDAYHVSGTLCQDKLCPETHYWLRVSDLYVLKITQHGEASGFTDDIAYTDPSFNTGATVPAP
jgi:hypothetical protein